jgi:hypothetical protein
MGFAASWVRRSAASTFAGSGMEKMMSKTTTHVITAKSEAPERDELSPEELDAVSGGGINSDANAQRMQENAQQLKANMTFAQLVAGLG